MAEGLTLLNRGVGGDWRESLDCKEIKPVNPKGNQSWIFIGRTDAEAEAPILWPPDGKSWLIWKDPDAEKDWRQEEKGWQRMRWLDTELNSQVVGGRAGGGAVSQESELTTLCKIWSPQEEQHHVPTYTSPDSHVGLPPLHLLPSPPISRQFYQPLTPKTWASILPPPILWPHRGIHQQ